MTISPSIYPHTNSVFGQLLSWCIIVFDILAILMVLFAGSQLVYKYIILPKVKYSYSLSNKNYSVLRSHFTHRVILSLDLFLVGDLIKIVSVNGLEALSEVFVIVIIRTILSYYLAHEIKIHQ